MKRFRLLASTLAVVALGLTLAACDAADPDPSVAPETPPPAAFAFDASFPEASNAQLVGAHFINGATRVVFVTAAVGVHLIVPAEATRIATEADPFVEDGTWIWENSASFEATTVTVRLEGTPDGTEIDWRLFVSSDDLGDQVYEDFVLYEATTSLDGSQGSWALFYDLEGDRTRVLDADFSVTTETVREITFTVPQSNPNAEARGASVRYAADGDWRLFDTQEATPGQTHLVEWNAATSEGFVEAWNYNEGARGCWDSNLDDVACTSN
jgi:hypothetical protein